MKRYIIEEREDTTKDCNGCIFLPVECYKARLRSCVGLQREDGKNIIFVLVKEEEIK